MTTKGSDSSNNGGWYTRNERKRRLPTSTEGVDDGGGGGGGGMLRMSSSSSSSSSTSISISNDIGKALSMSLVNDDDDDDDDEDLAKKSSPAVDAHSIQSSSLSSFSPSAIPASLAPYLGWTKLSSSASCRRRRIQQRRKELARARRLMALSDLEEEDEGGYRKVDGHAIFFIHDPLLDNNDENDVADEEDENEEGNERNKIWFQGRFFPSAVSGGQIIEANTIMNNHHNTPDDSNCIDSWGILAETGANDVDDCLLCPDGGYRILDLTFLRRAGKNGKDVSEVKEKYRRRWTARDLVWTGGNMMALTTEDYSLPLSSSMSRKNNNNGSADHDQVPFVNFEPCKLVEGKPAIELAAKYFPLLVRRLQVRDIIEDGIGSDRSLEDAMVLIGKMQVSAPASFVAATSAVGVDDF